MQSAGVDARTTAGLESGATNRSPGPRSEDSMLGNSFFVLTGGSMAGAPVSSLWVRETVGGLRRDANVSSTKQDAIMEFYGLPPIGQRRERPMDGAPACAGNPRVRRPTERDQ